MLQTLRRRARQVEQRREQGTIAEEVNMEEETALPVMERGGTDAMARQVHHRRSRQRVRARRNSRWRDRQWRTAAVHNREVVEYGKLEE